MHSTHVGQTRATQRPTWKLAPRGSRPPSSRSSAPGADSMVLARARPGAFRFDLRDNSVWWSDVVAEAFGRPPGFAPKDAEHYLSLVHELDREGARARIEAALAERGAFDAVERVVWPDGSVATVRCRVSAELSPDGELRGLTGTTELLGIEPPAPPVRHKRLRTDIGHDLRNLSQVLESQLELARLGVKGALSPAVIEETLASMARLVHELMSGAHEPSVAPQRIDLVGWFHGVSARLANAATACRRLVISLRRTEPLRVAADPSRLMNVLVNLIGNARDATGGGDSIRIKLSEEDGVVAVFEISDDGCGIDEETLDRVFERGYTTKGGGHGYGLASAREAIAEMGGWIQMQSQKGIGTRVSVFLPLLREGIET